MVKPSTRVRSIGLFTFVLLAVCGGAFAQDGFHKVVAAPGVIDEKTPEVRVVADYGTYRVYRIADGALASLSRNRHEAITIRDDMDVIRIDAYSLDTRSPVVHLPPGLTAAPAAGRALQLVQFVGPIKQPWLDELTRAGIRPIQYIESNAYLVFADAAGRQALDRFVAQDAFVQYSGPYHPYYKLGPTLRAAVSQAAVHDRLVPVTIQIFDHEAKSDTVARIEAAASSIDSKWEPVLTYRNLQLTVPMSRIAGLAALPDVTSIGERLPITLNDEKQDQIVAGHLNGSQSGPSAPGYKAFIDAKGFPTDPSAYPVVGLSDDGVGNGSAINGSNDPTFTKLGDGTTTRISFVQNCTLDPLGDGHDGHGHINTSIIGGYDVRAGEPFRDVDGYQRGMGINPYGRMAMTKIFRNGGAYSTTNCGGNDAGVIAASYGGGARISSNSWGCAGCAGTYDASSQAYDAGTRDALPGTAGNQEYLFVFSAGNSGPGAGTVGTPGNGKNMITVGASENDRNGWTDGCGVGPTGADNAMDVIGFSSRGPSPGGRKKPEVIAPGTHIQGTASTNATYDGSGVCDQYIPTTQTVFAASSGTSHSAPAVAGTASLYYRWLQDHYLTALPSPALLKAYMMTHTTYLTGVGANDTLLSNTQGTGMPNLEMALDATPRYLLDQSVRLDNSGDSWVFHGSVADASKPVRIVMVYTDAPGAVGVSPQVNNLDLQAIVGDSTYNGNVFTGPYSTTGGAPDAANNYEAVFLPAGTTGAITLTVSGFNIAGDGVPGTGDATDQDFALVCYNCATCAGAVSTDKATYGCNAPIHITLGDSDLAGAVTHTVTVRSTTEPAPESVTLTESPAASGVFVGSFPTYGGAPVNGDGKISVAHGDAVTIGYLDASACGPANVTVEQTAAIDCQPPFISNVLNGPIGGTTATVTWSTDEPADSGASFGASPPPGTTPPALPGLTMNHAFQLSGLAMCTPYVYSVASTDAAGNSASDDNGGTYYSFTTGANVVKNIPYAGSPVAIPDNNPAGGTAIINVPDNKVIADVNVTINSLTHTYDGDIVIHLIGPDLTDVILANHRGAGGANYVNTVFDDSAATPIASGSAPFTGSFIPDSPLSAFNGKGALGAWKLFVVDTANVDAGSINSFTLTFLLSQTCAPHATYGSHALVVDSCGSGAGGGNGIWESGEQVQFKVNVRNDGTVTLTGLSATVVPTTPGVTMMDGIATYPSVIGGASADSDAPHFTAQLPAGLTCASSVSFDVTINSDQGSWSSSYSQQIGQPFTGGGTAFTETFAAGIPPTWTIVDGGVGTGSAATWTTANPGARSIASPMAAPVAIVDSDYAGDIPGVLQDEELFTPTINLSGAVTAALQFDQYFRWYSGSLNEFADVDVRSSATGGGWINVLRQQGGSSTNPDHKTIDISAQAAGAANAQIRFHYYNAHYEFYWQIDNVEVDTTSAAGCNQTSCPTAPAVVKPVPDGSYGSPLTGFRVNPNGSTINVNWDVSSCVSTSYHILYGNLASVGSYAIAGSTCGIGTTGSYSWSGVPAGDLWFVGASDDGASTEGSWGTGSAGERGGAVASGQCGLSLRNNLGTCP